MEYEDLRGYWNMSEEPFMYAPIYMVMICPADINTICCWSTRIYNRWNVCIYSININTTTPPPFHTTILSPQTMSNWTPTAAVASKWQLMCDLQSEACVLPPIQETGPTDGCWWIPPGACKNNIHREGDNKLGKVECSQNFEVYLHGWCSKL